jgi:hypothetical protein
MKLTGKKILLISPQAWHKVKISKHHYAKTLAAKGNEVYFLNPPLPGNLFNQKVSLEAESPGLTCISFYAFAPLRLRYHFRAFFDVLMNFQVKRLMRKLAVNFDIVWSFEPNLYTDLGIFGASLKIFHPVDVFEYDSAIKTAQTADILFSVSPSILDWFGNINKPKHFINHGLSRDFSEMVRNRDFGLASSNGRKDKIYKVGYIGNLLIKYLDRDLFQSIILRNPNTQFLLIGPYETSQSTLSGDAGGADTFISFLKEQGNVSLMGPKGSEELPGLLQQCDAFLILYTDKFKGYDLSNTHKMLEYLSTGKVVFSTPIKTYENNNDLIVMPVGLPENDYETFFVEAIRNIDQYNSAELSIRRIELALENTYENQVDKIENYLSLNSLSRG